MAASAKIWFFGKFLNEFFRCDPLLLLFLDLQLTACILLIKNSAAARHRVPRLLDGKGERRD